MAQKPLFIFIKKSTNATRLLIDVSTIAHHPHVNTGIQRVVRNIALELMQGDFRKIEIKFIALSQAPICYQYVSHHIEHDNISFKFTHEMVQFYANDIFLGLDLSIEKLDVRDLYYSVLRENGIQLFFIVYDLLFIKNPAWWAVDVVNALHQWLKIIIKNGTGLICISKMVAKDLTHWLDEHVSPQGHRPNVSHFYLGADVHIKPLMNDIRLDFNPLGQKLIFLMVGTIEPRKGYSQALSAFELLWRQDIDVCLVIIGRPGWLVDSTLQRMESHPERNKRLYWFSDADDHILNSFYYHADCLISASEGEGFGLPLMEAATRHLDVIARDLLVFQELFGEYIYYFSGRQPEALATAIKNWIVLKSKDLQPKTSMIQWKTWKESSEELYLKLI